MPSGGHNKITFSEKEMQQIEIMCGLRLPMKYIAAIMGCSQTTLERRIREDDAFAAVVMRGRASAATKVHQTAFQMACSGKMPVMTIFWLKSQEGWKEDVLEVERSGDEDIVKAKDEAILKALRDSRVA